jgi:hypothetical protein
VSCFIFSRKKVEGGEDLVWDVISERHARCGQQKRHSMFQISVVQIGVGQ